MYANDSLSHRFSTLKTGTPFGLASLCARRIKVTPPQNIKRVGVGWQRRCKTRHPLRKQGNQVTDFFRACVFCGNHDGGRARSYCAG